MLHDLWAKYNVRHSDQLVETAVHNGVEYIGFGMAHRGRLNALKCVFNKAPQTIFAEFQESEMNSYTSWGNSGDVKYHLGITS
jgi:2-oxoglutarate dehydrogenase E1 component